MASLRRQRRSPYFYACFTLANGDRHQRSTKIRDDGRAASRRNAQAIANAYEADLARAQTAAQLQRVANDLQTRLFPKSAPAATVADFVTDWAERLWPGRTPHPCRSSHSRLSFQIPPLFQTNFLTNPFPSVRFFRAG